MKESKELVYEQLVLHVDPEPNLIDYNLAVKLDELNDLELNWILVRACEDEHQKIMKFFIRRRKKISRALPLNIRTAIHVAARANMPVSFGLLCDIYDNRTNYRDAEDGGFTHFQAACKIGHELLAEMLLSTGQVSDNLNLVLQSLAKIKPNPGVVRLLLANGALPDLADANGTTLLSGYCRQLATMSRCTPADKLTYLELIRVFVESKADVNASDQEGVTPIKNLYRHGVLAPELQLAALKILLEAGADVKHVSRSGESVLHFAVRRRYLAKCHGKVFDVRRHAPEICAVLRLLVTKYGADLDVLDDIGDSPLNCAVTNCNLDAVRTLLELGADPCTVTFEGGLLEPANEFLRNLEMTRNILDIIELLKKHGYQMTEKREAWVLRFLLGFSPSHTHFDAAYVIALASNASMIRNHCTILTTYQDEVAPVLGALSNHLRIVDFGKMYTNGRAKDCMVEMMQNLEEGGPEDASSDSDTEKTGRKLRSKDLYKITYTAIVDELSRASKTMIKSSASLLDLCTCSPEKAYAMLEDSCWERLLDNEDAFNRDFMYTGPTIKGYIARALARKYLDGLKPQVSMLVLQDEFF